MNLKTIFHIMLETSQSPHTVLLKNFKELVFFSFRSCAEDIFNPNYLSSQLWQS